MESLFYFLTFLSVISGLMVIFARNPIHSVLYLILTFFSIAGHYILLNAQFLAVVHIIVYAGAIMVLFLFVIMLLNLNANTEPHQPKLIRFAGVITGGLLMLTIVAAIKQMFSENVSQLPDQDIGLVQNIGKTLFKDFLLPFEISTILFLTAMIGAVMLGKKNVK